MSKRHGPRNPRLPDDLADTLSEVLFEFRQAGNILRVTAIDPRSGTEVITVADPAQSETAIKTVAARKLAYVLRKKAAQRKGGGNPPA